MLNNRNAVGIIKLSGFLAVLICCILALTVSASAAAINKIQLRASGSEAQITIDFPQAAAEGIASMQLSLSICVSNGTPEIEFIPDSRLSAKIAESRYHSETGVLNIYLAGSEPLFSGSSPLSVGKVKIKGGSASATVSIAEGSVKLVRGSELIEGENLSEAYGEIAYPEPVIITTKTEKPNYSSSSDPHTHSYGDWTVTVNATCFRDGERIRVCEICGRTETEIIPKVDHEYIPLESHEADDYTDYICVYCARTKRESGIILIGDVDRNGSVNSLDAAAILKASVNKTDMSPDFADYNKDGAVNALDAAAILKWIVSR